MDIYAKFEDVEISHLQELSGRMVNPKRGCVQPWLLAPRRQVQHPRGMYNYQNLGVEMKWVSTPMSSVCETVKNNHIKKKPKSYNTTSFSSRTLY